ncbi:Trichoplein keratin filament-binding protein, partial [Stegodyphus mimosarum]
MEELKRLSDKEREKDPWNICRLKEQIEDLQRKRKEGEQNMQKRYMHHLFKSNSCSKETDEELLQKEIAQAWEKRKEELEKLSIEKQEKEREKIKILESEQLKATREAREVEMEQLKEQESWANFIQKKMDDLNAAENETKKLKAEKDILIEHMETLLSLQQRRDLVRDLQRKGFQRIQSMWQPRDKLRRMLNEVQHGLDFDSKLLVSLSEMNSTATEDTALALLNLDSVKETKEKINMQIALEKERELEIQQLYHEEASTLWEKRKEDWYLESVARDQIMNDLFKTLADEINKKLDYNLEQQRKYVHLKETCLKEIDEENEKVRQAKKTLEEKERYFIERAKRLGEELESITAIKCELPARK